MDIATQASGHTESTRATLLYMKSTSTESGYASRNSALSMSAGDDVAAGGDTVPLLSEEQVAPILIVDDEPFVADLINHWVHDVWDYHTIIAHSGDDAIVAMREKQIGRASCR